MQRGDILKRIQGSDEYAIGALIALHRLQTPEEQQSHITYFRNNIGFNYYDAPKLSKVLEKHINGKPLKSEDIKTVQNALTKYHGQLKYLNITPTPVNKALERKKFAEGAWANILKEGGSNRVAIKIRYNRGVEGDIKFREKAEIVKGLGGWFGYDSKVWDVRLNEANCKKLIDSGFTIGARLQAWYDKITYVPAVRRNINVKGLNIELYPFQKYGVAFIQSRQGRALIADEMGLGKTIQALAWVHYANAYPALCIVPASVKLNWAREIQKFLPPEISVTLLYGRKVNKNGRVTLFRKFKGVSNTKSITIINYDIIDAWKDHILETPPKTVILDEVQMIKTNSARRTKAAKLICKGRDHVISLSGTPILNRPSEFFNCLNILDPEQFKDFWSYANKFVGPRSTAHGWSFTGAKNKNDLHQLLKKTVMLRRLKTDVLKELPAKQRSVIPYEIDNRAEYIYAENQFIAWVKENYGEERAIRASNAEALAKIEYLKQLTVKGKMKQIYSWVNDFLESTDQKLIVFAIHRATVDQIHTTYGGKSVKIYGGMSLPDRQESIDRFQKDDGVRLLVGNIKSAGTGINLTAASTTCFIELGWTPAEHDQAEDRVHRIGQEAESVNAYYLVAERTIEEDIAFLLDQKREVITGVLDGQSVDKSSVLTDLLTKYFGKSQSDKGVGDENEGIREGNKVSLEGVGRPGT